MTKNILLIQPRGNEFDGFAMQQYKKSQQGKKERYKGL